MDENDQQQMYSCPTFSSYSSNNLAAIAVRVANEFNNGRQERSNASGEVDEILIEEEEDDDDFEFSLERDPSDIFFDDDGQNKTVYPIFNLDPHQGQNQGSDNNDDISKSGNVIDTGIGIPLSRLLIEERERRDVMSASSSEDEETASIPPGSYCVWKPKVKELSSPNMCNKSKSTGSTSKRWKFLDLLRRSNSEGNENYVYMTPKHREKHSEKIERPRANKTQTLDAVPKRAGKAKTRGTTAAAASPSAHETFYVRNRAIKESDKRKSYLPQVLVGVFANVNALTRTYPPF